MMRVRGLTVLGALLVLTTSSRRLAAQQPIPRGQVTLDAGLLAGGLSYARMTSPDKLVGMGLGLGFEFNLRLVHGEPWGTKSTEIAHVELFERLETAGRWEYDLGVRIAGDLHTAQVASEAAPGGFLGGYIAPMWGGRHFRIGPRVQAGAYWSSRRPSFGVSITPLEARLRLTF
jgi:hypothetical protein